MLGQPMVTQDPMMEDEEAQGGMGSMPGMGGPRMGSMPGSALSREGQNGMSSMLGGQYSQLMGGGPPGSSGSPSGSPSSSPSSSAMASGGSEPGSNPMLQARDQFQSLGAQVQALTQMYPMAQQELNLVIQGLMAAMIKIAQGVQQEPMMPGVGV